MFSRPREGCPTVQSQEWKSRRFPPQAVMEPTEGWEAHVIELPSYHPQAETCLDFWNDIFIIPKNWNSVPCTFLRRLQISFISWATRDKGPDPKLFDWTPTCAFEDSADHLLRAAGLPILPKSNDCYQNSLVDWSTQCRIIRMHHTALPQHILDFLCHKKKHFAKGIH